MRPGHTALDHRNDDMTQSKFVFTLAKEQLDSLCQLLHSKPRIYTAYETDE